MSPDSPTPSGTRKAWRVAASLGCVLGAVGLLVSSIAWNALNTRADEIARLGRENQARIHDIAANTRRINEQRRRSLIMSCERAEQQNRAIVQFLTDLHARPETLTRARALFPTRIDCAAQARNRAPGP